MIDVEPVQLAVRDDVDPRQLLRLEHDGCGILKSLLARRSDEPINHRVTTHNGGLNSAHGGCRSARFS